MQDFLLVILYYGVREMMLVKMLYVDACVRGGESRTARLADAFLDTCRSLTPNLSVKVHRLTDMAMKPLDAATLAMKEALCDARAWEHPFLRAAVEFQSADVVVIAAPYWDLSFPSMLKVWVEHMYVRNLTFRYENDRCIGLCRARESVYITTSGSPIGDHDWGAGYMKAVLSMMGIPGFTSIRAEALDLAESDAEAILRAAEQQAEQAARSLAMRLTGGTAP